MLRKICGDSPRMELPEKKVNVKVVLALLILYALGAYTALKAFGIL